MKEETCQIRQRFVSQPREMDQWTWIWKRAYYNEYYDDDLHLVTTDENSCSGESEAESYNDFEPHDSVSWPRFLF